MIPDKTAIFIALAFITLLVSHYLALKVGYRMGSKMEPPGTIPSTNGVKYNEAPDIYDKERLDFQ